MKLLVVSGGGHPYEESTPVLEKFLLAKRKSVFVLNEKKFFFININQFIKYYLC